MEDIFGRDYQTEAHNGIKEYYKSYGVEVAPGGISPKQEFNRDTRNLVFLDTGVVSEAFLHHETRRLDNAGCFSFLRTISMKPVQHLRMQR